MMGWPLAAFHVALEEMREQRELDEQLERAEGEGMVDAHDTD